MSCSAVSVLFCYEPVSTQYYALVRCGVLCIGQQCVPWPLPGRYRPLNLRASRHLPVLQCNALDCTAFNWNTSFCGVDTVLWPLFCAACFLFSRFSRRPVCCLLCSVSSVSYLVSPLHCCVHCLVFVLSVLLGLIVLPAHSRERWLARCSPPHSQCSKSSFSVFIVLSLCVLTLT